MTSLLTGLMTVWELVDDVNVQATQDDVPMNVRAEAKARLGDYKQ